MRYTATDIIVSIIFTWGICLIWPLLVRFAIVKRPISKSRAVCLSVLFLLVNLVIVYCLGSTNKTHLPLYLVALISYTIMHKGYYKKGSDIIVRKEKLKSENGEQNEDIPETIKTPQVADSASATASMITNPVGAEQKKTTEVENSPPVETYSDLRILLGTVTLIFLIAFLLIIISSNLGGPQASYSQEVKQYRKAAEQGDADAQFNLGFMYDYGQGVEQDYGEAAKWYRKAAEQGDVSSQYDLGVMYYNGQGVEQDYKETAKWYRKAAEQGHGSAQFDLGLMYSNGQGVEQDYGEAVKWYRKAAEQGYVDAQYNLGVMYYIGQGVEQNYKEAAKWYHMAAEPPQRSGGLLDDIIAKRQGNASAQYNLGIMYSNGQGVEQDYGEAVKWFRKAAEQGDAWAQNHLGAKYSNGQGVEQDYGEAVKWYRKAAEQGDAVAQNNLGLMYHKGQGVVEDYIEAVKWYRKAAEQGDAGAQCRLGGMYVIGQGVIEDYIEAYKWLLLAGMNGRDVTEFKELLRSEMSHGQIVEAQRLAKAFE